MSIEPILVGILLFVIVVVSLLVWLGKAGRTRRAIRKREALPLEQQIAAASDLGGATPAQVADAWRFIARCYRLDPAKLRPFDTVGYLNDTDYIRGDLMLPIEAALKGSGPIAEETPLLELATIVALRGDPSFLSAKFL